MEPILEAGEVAPRSVEEASTTLLYDRRKARAREAPDPMPKGPRNPYF
jgi:hypothetical protein